MPRVREIAERSVLYKSTLAILAVGALIFFGAGPLLVVPSPSCCPFPDDWETEWNRKQPPDKVMDAVGIDPGMVVAEIGAGRGRYAVQVAARVGNSGKVYAEDIDAEALDYVRLRCRRDGISNVEIILGDVTDPKLPAGSCDFVYMINTYHHIELPVPLLQNVVPALKPSGKLVIIEHSPDKVEEKDYGYHSTPPDSVLAHASRAGFRMVDRHSFLELDEIYVFQADAASETAE